MLAAFLVLTACGSGVTQDEYNKIVSENETGKKELENTRKSLSDVSSELEKTKEDYETAKKDLETVKKDLEKCRTDYDALKEEYDKYKEKMKPFEEMTAAQAEAEKAKAEEEKRQLEEAEAQRKAEEEAAQKAAEEEAAAAAAEEEAKGYETGITYDQLARTPDDYKGKKIKFYGKVAQVMEGNGMVHIRLAVNDDYDTILYCEYSADIVSSRVLEDDHITIYGTSYGLYSYESTMGKTVTIPAAIVDRIDQ